MKVRKITDRKDYDLYTTDVTYDYSIDDIISSGITDTQSIIDAVIGLYLPGLDIKYKAPEFGCSAFSTGDTRGHVLTGTELRLQERHVRHARALQAGKGI